MHFGMKVLVFVSIVEGWCEHLNLYRTLYKGATVYRDK